MSFNETLNNYTEQIEIQRKIQEYSPLLQVKPITITNSLENEKQNFLYTMSEIINNYSIENNQIYGRPNSDLKEIIKNMLIMSYNGTSYRRTQSELKLLQSIGIIEKIIPRTTLNDYYNQEEIKNILEKLITLTATLFTEQEDTLILDSTWLGLKMYAGGHIKVYRSHKTPNLEKCRKIHTAILKNSKMIAVAITTIGTANDNPLFKKIILKATKNFNIKTVLADAGYLSKDNYALCQEQGIQAYIDFKKNSVTTRSGSIQWRTRLREYKNNPEKWHEIYRYRPVIEGVFSAIKRKNLNWLRSKKPISQDIELLLKVLVYNLTIIGKYNT